MNKGEDVREWLERERDAATAARDEAFKANDYLAANAADARANGYYAAAEEIRTSRDKLLAFGRVLQARIIIALREADGKGG